jgi:superfamily II DNA or RNA helicase
MGEITVSILPPRDYQEECIADFTRRLYAGDTRIPSVMATGLGKTVVFAHISSRWDTIAEEASIRLALKLGKRILGLAHTDELVLQMADKMRKIAPDKSVGIVKAETNQTQAQIVCASVQTLRSENRRRQIRNVGLVIVDECHHAVATTYRQILHHYGVIEYDKATTKFEKRAVAAGFTATLARGDKEKLSDVWQDCTFKRGISFGIRRGYLLDVRGKRIEIPDFDLSHVKKSGGDYQEGALAEELDRTFAPSIVAEKYREYAADRKGIVFVPTVESACHFANAFNEAGISADVVHGKLGRLERRLLLKRLASGDLQVIINCAVLTEGFDDPTISCIVIARPTRSAPLYQQMVGRGLRPDLSLPPDQRGDCLVLDVVGASRAHDLRSLVDLSEREIRDEFALDEDLSLLQMEEAEGVAEEEEGESPPDYYGPAEAVDFDPLGRMGIGAWLKTTAGHYFLPLAEKAYVVIIPGEEPNTFDVAWLTSEATLFAFTECPGMGAYFSGDRVCTCGGNHSGTPGKVTEHKGLSLEMATSWSEEVMEEMGGKDALLLGAHKKPWRKKPATDAQKGKLFRWNIDTPEGMTRGEAADAITQTYASKRIDPIVAFMMQLREGEK